MVMMVENEEEYNIAIGDGGSFGKLTLIYGEDDDGDDDHAS